MSTTSNSGKPNDGEVLFCVLSLQQTQLVN